MVAPRRGQPHTLFEGGNKPSMNCIDGIEGVLKCILAAFQERYAAGELDDTEFTANLRSVIEGAAPFLDQNKEIGTSADLLKKVLYKECRQWWLDFSASKREKNALEDGEEFRPQDEEYYGD